MKKVIGEWIGKKVQVTLRATVPTPLEGTLLDVDESGILLDMPTGMTFIPVTGILYISLVVGL